MHKMAKSGLLQLNVGILKVLAMYPIHYDNWSIKATAFWLYKIFVFINLYSVFIPCVCEIDLEGERKITDYSLNIMNTGAYMCNILTFHFFYIRNETGYTLVTEMNQHFKYYSDAIFSKKTMESVDKRTRKITIGFISLLTSGVCFMALGPLFISEKILPIPGIYPFDWKKTPIYQIVYAWQFYAQLNVGYIASSSDAFFISMVLVAAEQFKILAYDFHNCVYKAMLDAGVSKEAILQFRHNLGRAEKFPEQSVNNSNPPETSIAIDADNVNINNMLQSKKFQSKLQSLLIRYIKHHQMLLKLCNKIEDFFWPLILMKVATSMFYHIFISFAMVTSTDSTMTMILAQYEFCAISELFIFSLAGQAIIVQSENVRDALYKSPWNFCSEQYKKTVMMIIMRCERPSRLSVGKLVDISLPTFITIMKTAFSYFAVLRQVTE